VVDEAGGVAIEDEDEELPKRWLTLYSPDPVLTLGEAKKAAPTIPALHPSRFRKY